MVMLVNGTLENFEKTEFFIKGVAFDTIIPVDKDGKEREAEFERTRDTVCVERPLPYMSTVTFKLKKRQI